jgi:acyl-CoA synthetase (AMP-forming)/AMP-acid ligase II/acyl carrier protein
MIARPLGELLADAARLRPQAVALLAPGRPPLTHGELAAQIDAVGRALRARGIGRRQRVAVSLSHGPELMVMLTGVAVAATAIPLNPSWRRTECLGAVAASRLDALVVAAGGGGAVREAAHELGIPVVDVEAAPPHMPAGVVTFSSEQGHVNSARERAEPAEGDHVAVVFHTSGTTALPKRVPLSHANVSAGVATLGTTIGLTAADRCLAVMPLFHVHGLMTAWSALVAGGSVACPPTFDPTRVLAWFAEIQPTWYSAVPTIHQAILDLVRVDAASLRPLRLRLIRSASAPLAPAVAAELEDVLGVPVVEAYGMTEAAHQIAVSPLGARKPGSVGLPTGWEVAIIDDAGQPLAVGATGEISIRGPGLTAGYEDDAAGTAATLVDGWFRTGDLGRRDGDGHLFITGRRKDLVNRGGEKIAPREVEDVLAAHPAVAESAVFAVPHPTLGEDLAASVVLRAGATATERDIRAFAALALSATKVPATVRFVDRLARGPSGKIDRTALAASVVPRAAAMSEPRTSTEVTLAAIVARVLNVRRVGVDQSFFLLGGDSLKAAMLVARVGKAFGVDLPLTAPFDAPTVAELAEQIDRAPRAYPATPIAAVSRAGPLPLAFPQLRFWFLHELDPTGSAFNVLFSFCLRGRLSADALKRSLSALVARHEVFRTSFATGVDEEPVQRILASADIDVSVRDLRGLAAGTREAAVRQCLDETRDEPFDLARPPLLRAQLLQLTDGEHVLALCTHHIAIDGWSAATVTRELGELYRAFVGGRSPDLPALPVQYADFAVWQRAGSEDAAQLAWWCEHLRGELPARLLPTDRDRPEGRRSPARHVGITLSAELTGRLERLGSDERATPFMIILAALSLLLHRYSGQDDIVIGAPLAGRLRPEIEQLVGCFLNLAALRIDVGGHPTFGELLRRARDATLGAYANQDVPFERVLEARARERLAVSRTPLFEVLLNMHEFEEHLALPGLEAEILPSPPPEPLFDLTLYFRHGPRGLELTLTGNADLLGEERMVEMLAQIRAVLEQAAASPERAIDDFSLVTDGIRVRLPDPAATLDRAWHGAVHERVSAQAWHTPARLAVHSADERWTYGELEAASNRLAHALHAAGVGPEDVVAIWARRSPSLVHAILAALKAGAAYTILDPAYPEGRLADAVEVAQPRAWIEIGGAPPLPPRLEWLARDARWRGRLGPGLDTAAVLAGPDLDRQATKPPAVPVGPDSLATVVFTSGSTGRPRAVLGRHGSLSHFLPWQCQTFALKSEDRFAMLSALAHDPLQRDIFTPLWVGAAVCVPDADHPAGLAGWMEASEITVANLTPATIQILAEDAANVAQVVTLRWAFIVGEALTRRDLARLRALAPSARAVNLYGATETSARLDTTSFPTITPRSERRSSRSVAPFRAPSFSSWTTAGG